MYHPEFLEIDDDGQASLSEELPEKLYELTYAFDEASWAGRRDPHGELVGVKDAMRKIHDAIRDFKVEGCNEA